MNIYCSICRDTQTPVLAHVIWCGHSLCWGCLKDAEDLDKELQDDRLYKPSGQSQNDD